MAVVRTTCVFDDGARPVRGGVKPQGVVLRMTTSSSLTLKAVVVSSGGYLVDLTGFTAYLSVRKQLQDFLPTFRVSGTLVPAEGPGRLDFSVLPATTKNLEAGRYWYDVWLISGAGIKQSVLPTAPFVLEPTLNTP